jgi:hypothetical protein
VYIALLFLIFLVVLFPYKEGFTFDDTINTPYYDISGSSYSDSSSSQYNDISNGNVPQYPYTF